MAARPASRKMEMSTQIGIAFLRRQKIQRKGRDLRREAFRFEDLSKKKTVGLLDSLSRIG